MCNARFRENRPNDEYYERHGDQLHAHDNSAVASTTTLSGARFYQTQPDKKCRYSEEDNNERKQVTYDLATATTLSSGQVYQNKFERKYSGNHIDPKISTEQAY